MKMTIAQAIVAAEAIAAVKSKRFPIKMSYALNKSFSALSKERQTAEEERMKLCKMYAEKGADGEPIIEDNVYKMTPEGEQKCSEEYAKLLKTETDVDVHQFPICVMEEAEKDTRYDVLTVRELDAISVLISDE